MKARLPANALFRALLTYRLLARGVIAESGDTAAMRCGTAEVSYRIGP
ncbi:MAG: hypothetical protein LBB48_05460 [Treponema sp.]|nr:hypothetical protein [Treponema sp.]